VNDNKPQPDAPCWIGWKALLLHFLLFGEERKSAPVSTLILLVQASRIAATTACGVLLNRAIWQVGPSLERPPSLVPLLGPWRLLACLAATGRCYRD